MQFIIIKIIKYIINGSLLNWVVVVQSVGIGLRCGGLLVQAPRQAKHGRCSKSRRRYQNTEVT